MSTTKASLPRATNREVVEWFSGFVRRVINRDGAACGGLLAINDADASALCEVSLRLADVVAELEAAAAQRAQRAQWKGRKT